MPVHLRTSYFACNATEWRYTLLYISLFHFNSLGCSLFRATILDALTH